MSSDLNPNKHTWNELERRARGRVNAPANVRELFPALKQEWVAIPSASDSQPDPVHASKMLGSYWLSRRTETRITQSQNNDWLNLLLDEKNVQILNFDLHQLQNEIWWTWFLVKLSNNSILKQTKYTFLFWTVYKWISEEATTHNETVTYER